MKKLIALTAIAGMLVIAGGPALTVAQGNIIIDTSFSKGDDGGQGAAPIIKAKWEMNGPCFDQEGDWEDCLNSSPGTGNIVGEGTDDSADPGAQFNAPGVHDDDADYTICAIVTDPDGPDNIDTVFANIYYPEDVSYHPEAASPFHDIIGGGTESDPDYGQNACGDLIEEKTLVKLDKEDGIELFCNEIRNDNDELPTFFDIPGEENVYGYDEICGVTGELEQEDAYVYCADMQLYYEWPAGDYKAEVFARDFQDNSSDSEISTENFFEYLPLTSFDMDFTSVNYGEVFLNVEETVSGDDNFDEEGDNPTVRNLGNTRLYMEVAQDDMGLGQTSGDWNVGYEARIGSNAADWMAYDPFKFKANSGSPNGDDWKQLEDILDLSQDESINFSIMVTDWPDEEDSFSGQMWLGADTADFRQCVNGLSEPVRSD